MTHPVLQGSRIVGLALVVALSSISFESTAHASCGAPGISVWPPRHWRLPAVPEVVVRAGTEEVKRLRKATFVAGKHVVQAKFVSSDEGYGTTQVVLRASSPLRLGESYALQMPGRAEPIGTWTIDAHEDGLAPQITGTPQVEVSPLEMYGCGPARPVLLSGLDANRSALLEVTLVGPDKTTERQRIIRTERGYEIGYGMCGGAFLLKDGVTYEGRAIAVDLAGRRSAEVRFTFSTK